jgi:acetolactate decarboxylase
MSRPANAVYLSTPINALVEGFYTDKTSLGDVKAHGDFGLGTFNSLDGEMVLLDGIAYQISARGEVRVVTDTEKTPFACVTFFRPDTEDEWDQGMGTSDVFQILDHLVPSSNMLYALRIDGVFDAVTTRAVPKTENYIPLVEAAKHQVVFEFKNATGVLAGFYTPGFMASLAAPGYHLHMLSDDRRSGGHLMACRIRRARVAIQHIPKLEVDLPVTLDYLTADFNRDARADLNQAEK